MCKGWKSIVIPALPGVVPGAGRRPPDTAGAAMPASNAGGHRGWQPAPRHSAQAAESANVKRAPRPGSPLSARMQPPCASTSPFETATPRPEPAVRPARLRNRRGSCPDGMPPPSSETDFATRVPSRAASTPIGDGPAGGPRRVREEVAQPLRAAVAVGHREQQAGRPIGEHGAPQRACRSRCRPRPAGLRSRPACARPVR